MSQPVRITVDAVADPNPLAAEWRALEDRADASFFQGWTWVGCRAGDRFANAVVLRAEQGGALVGLALLNRARGRLWLGESGDPAWDAVYVEHNGPLLARGRADLLEPCLRALARGRLVLAGVDAAQLRAARAIGVVRLRQSDPAPYADLAALPAGEAAYLDSLSGNTRYQIRRSDRFYAMSGPIAVRRAATVDEAWAFLDALAVLHQATWTARGRPGAFARPEFRAFHRALLARAVPRGEAELLRIAAGARIVGYLYNFRHRGHVLAYQSGFDYADAGAHGKPGLTCHHAAIAEARRDGAIRYDFLAGDDRYKTSLSHGAVRLHWLEVAPRWSLAGVGFRARAGWKGNRR